MIPGDTHLILHSDQGWHYRHKHYVSMLEEKGHSPEHEPKRELL